MFAPFQTKKQSKDPVRQLLTEQQECVGREGDNQCVAQSAWYVSSRRLIKYWSLFQETLECRFDLGKWTSLGWKERENIGISELWSVVSARRSTARRSTHRLPLLGIGDIEDGSTEGSRIG